MLEPFEAETGSSKSQDTCHTAPLVDYKLDSNIVTLLNKGLADRGCRAMSRSFATHVVTSQVVNDNIKLLFRGKFGKVFGDRENRALCNVCVVQPEQNNSSLVFHNTDESPRLIQGYTASRWKTFVTISVSALAIYCISIE